MSDVCNTEVISMMKLIVFTSALTAGSLFMAASYAADEVQAQEQAMDQRRSMQNIPGMAQPGMRQNMNQYGPGSGQGGMQQHKYQRQYQYQYKNGPGQGQGGGMNRQGGGMGL
jgi:Na+-transporting NADH:ubiquinone oxidoreductase subunit NqrC